MGAWGTPLMYAFREREKILDLFESLSGSRMMCNYMRFGGCRVDLPPGWMERAREIVDRFPALSRRVRTAAHRQRNPHGPHAGRRETFRRAGDQRRHHRPGLRASGVNYDIRKVDGYGIYPRFKFRVPLGEHGDVYDRS